MSTPQCGTRMRMCPICTTSIGTIGEAGCHYSSFAGSTNIRGATVIGLLTISSPKKTPALDRPLAPVGWIYSLPARARSARMCERPHWPRRLKTKLRRLRSSFTRQSGRTPKRTAMAYEFRTKCAQSGGLETNGPERENFGSGRGVAVRRFRAKGWVVGDSCASDRQRMLVAV